MSLIINTFNESGAKFLPWKKISNIVETILKSEGKKEANVNIIVLDDNQIHEMNKEYLSHDYPTDVISFILEEAPLDGEVYISVDTAKEQAKDYKVSLSNEMTRLVAHGTLHLCGYDDDTKEKRAFMTNLENKYLGEVWKG